MKSDITDYATTRYAAKVYDPNRRISDEDMAKIRLLLRMSPSSTNLQPWKFVLATTETGKARIAKAVERLYPFNKPSIMNASAVVVFASRLEADEAYLMRILDQEEADGRFAADPEAFKARMHAGRKLFLNLHQQQGLNDVQHWMDKQVYLNIGQFLLGVATLGIDATPMEGVETSVLDEEFGLREQGYSSLVIVPIGYADRASDYNAALPKSRLPYDEILVEV